MATINFISSLPKLTYPSKLSQIKSPREPEFIGVLRVKVARVFDSNDVDAHVIKYVSGRIPNPIYGYSNGYGYLTLNRPKDSFYYAPFIRKVCDLSVYKLTSGDGKAEAYFCEHIATAYDEDDSVEIFPDGSWRVKDSTEDCSDDEEGGLTI